MIEEILKKTDSVRIDIKNYGIEENEVKIKAGNGRISTPGWYKNEQGVGVVYVSNSTTCSIKITIVKDGKLRMIFRGEDCRLGMNRFPVWIDYKSIKIDGKEILKKPVQTWHDKPFIFEMPVKDGQEVIVKYVQRQHHYNQNEAKELIARLNLSGITDIEGFLEELFIKHHISKREKLQLEQFIPDFNTVSKKPLIEYKVSPCNKKIKINIVDVYKTFDKQKNSFVKSLSKYYSIEFSEKPDFLFYSCFGNEHLKYDHCVKIFFTGENVLPNFNECDYAWGFDYINFSDRYFRKNYVHPSKEISDRHFEADAMLNRRFCNFIYSNSNSGEGTILRQEFCKELMKYKPVDCPGRVLHNMDTDELEPRNGDWIVSKIAFLKKYKFTIAFENSSSNGYTTEKLFQPLQSFSIPIYWGNPLVTRDFNPKAFINVNDYDNDFKAVIERVKELDNDPDKYLAMLRESPMQPDFDFDQFKKMENWLVSIIEKGNKPFNKDPRNWDKTKVLKIENEQLKSEVNDLRNKVNQIKSILNGNYTLLSKT